MVTRQMKPLGFTLDQMRDHLLEATGRLDAHDGRPERRRARARARRARGRAPAPGPHSRARPRRPGSAHVRKSRAMFSDTFSSSGPASAMQRAGSGSSSSRA